VELKHQTSPLITLITHDVGFSAVGHKTIKVIINNGDDPPLKSPAPGYSNWSAASTLTRRLQAR
jgi:hypothetical protein